ncbi:MAG: pitrilysin family protein [bacterium]|nr:pitrilysin family protein [bacterium]
MELKIKKSDITGETVYYGTHSSGLGIYIIPKKDYSQNYAIFGTRYGSVDSKFVVPGETAPTEVPDGIAHYLEHKMFDQPDGSNVFDKFSRYGANANAFTSFNMTAYLFNATANIEENLSTLLDYVQSPYYTPETVQKEQGIIGQEINMYDDNGSWKVFFNFLGCLYNNHPVKKEIAGTIESISHITDDYLYKCYNTFYNLSNMAIVVVGDVNPDRILNVIENGIKKNEPFTEEIQKLYPDEPAKVANHYAEQKLSVAMPLFMMGFKDTDVGYGGKKLLKKNIEMNILLQMLFGKSSHFYRSLYEQGLITPSYAVDYTMQPDYGFTSIEGESNNPKQVYDMMLAEIDKVNKIGLDKDDFVRIKKVIWGRYIRTMNNVEDYGTMYIQLLFMGIDYLDYYDVYNEINFEDITKRFEQHFIRDNAALSVVWPIE